jgi:hypothetical protein
VSKGNVWYWLLSERPRRGERFVYYEGFLARDRDPFLGKEFAHDIIDNIGREAWKASCEGLVALVQQRVSKGYYKYMAVKT